MTEEKSFSVYQYDKPLETTKPQWSTDVGALSWSVGGYSSPRLPAGIYTVESDWDSPPYLLRLQVKGDNLLDLPSDPSTIVLNHILDFWSKEQSFRDLGVTYKRGILLYGPPGSGKSVTIFRLAAMLEQQDAVMLITQSSSEARTGISIIKKLEPTRKIVVVFEDIDGIISRYGDESMTHLLDGAVDVDNVLFLATTNYPHRLPDRLLNRPSRFDVVIRIGMPNAEARRFYVTSIVKNLLVDIEELVAKTRNLSFAQIKEAIILIEIFGYSIEEAITRLTTSKISNTDNVDDDDDDDYNDGSFISVN